MTVVSRLAPLGRCALSRAFLVVATAALLPLLQGAGPRVLPDGELPKDSRLEALKDLNGYFPFVPPKSSAEWTKRAERVRMQILVSNGLWPMPEKSPLNAVVHSRIERDGYSAYTFGYNHSLFAPAVKWLLATD